MPDSKPYINYSGGAEGADIMWERIGRQYGFDQHFHFWYGKKTPYGNKELYPEEYEEGIEHVYIANKTLKRKGFEKYLNLLARNWLQIRYSHIVYAIATIRNNVVQGGTGWAVQMAIDQDYRGETFVFDQNENQWYVWIQYNSKWCKVNKPNIINSHYAGIGTRQINSNGIEAIHQVYRISTGKES